MSKLNRRILSPEQEQWARKMIPGKTGERQSAMIFRRFGIRMTVRQLKAWRKNHHVSSGLTGSFEKGHPSPNKGVPMPRRTYEAAKATMFKKGQRPWNDRFKVGDVRIVKWHHGELCRRYEKVSDSGTLWERWKPVCYMALARAGRPVPKDSCVIHLDKDPLNDDLGNLFVVKRSIYGPMQRMRIMGRDEATMKAAELIVQIGHRTWALKEKRRAENKKRKKHAEEHSD